jgi:putative toxin-antitoxin system antitoxin component (TIGR02293 family)
MSTGTSVEQESGSLYTRLGQLLGLRHRIVSDVDLVDQLEQGLSVSVVQSLRDRAGLTDEEVYQLVAPRRTLRRREAERQALSADEADRAVRVARVAARAQQIFGANPKYAEEWLRTPQRSLGDRAPLQMLASESGARVVEELLLGIEHGMFA